MKTWLDINNHTLLNSWCTIVEKKPNIIIMVIAWSKLNFILYNQLINIKVHHTGRC